MQEILETKKGIWIFINQLALEEISSTCKYVYNRSHSALEFIHKLNVTKIFDSDADMCSFG